MLVRSRLAFGCSRMKGEDDDLYIVWLLPLCLPVFCPNQDILAWFCELNADNFWDGTSTSS